MLKWAVSREPLYRAIKNCACFNQQQTVTAFYQGKLLGLLPRRFCVYKTNKDNTISHLVVQNSLNKLSLATFSQSGSSFSDQQPTVEEQKLSNKDKLKRAVKDYGSTVIVFHVALSLTTLGISYLTISSGVDVHSLLGKVGLSSSSELAAGASTFVVAYAVHKMFAPVRISITLGATPFIVRYLRRVGVLKPPKTTGK